MSISETIIEVTDGGKAIMTLLYPSLVEYIDNGKKFRSPYRTDPTPSAHFWKSPDGIYFMKDFGGETLGPINAYMKERGCNFSQAIRELCQEFGIDEHNGRTHNNYPHSDYSKRKAIPNTPDGRYIEAKDFTSSELRFLCPLQEDDVREACKKYGMESLKRLYIVKGSEEKSFQSNTSYPMYARTAKMIDAEGNVQTTVHKVYQPRYHSHDNKNYKFSYLEDGTYPDRIINGLYELKQVVVGEDDKKPIAVICCGERDAICVAAAGAYPIWFNSEGHKITSYEMFLIRKFAGQVYYIPDIDEPGWEAALRNMKAFPELKVVELPQELRHKKGDQHKACKDLRDWMQLNPTREAFWRLLNTSHTYKITKYTKRGCVLSADGLVFFLRINGYRKYYNKYTKEYQLAHISGYQIENVTREQIRDFIQNNISDYLPEERDAVLSSSTLDRNINDVETIDVNFASATATSQVLYFNNMPVVITADGICPTDAKQTSHVMKSKVINLDVCILPPMFTYVKAMNLIDETKPHYDITFLNTDSPAMQFVMRASDIHWDKRERGEKLTESEEFEVMQNFQTWIYNIGYLLHRFRSPTTTFAPFLLEYMHYDGVSANGGTGKTVFPNYLFPKMGYKITKVDAHDPKIFDKFLLQEIEPDTDLLFIDEMYDGFPMRNLNGIITGGLAVEKKNKQKHTFRPEDSPKTALISNFDPRDHDPSTERRINYMPLSHFFHYKSNNSYFKESRSLADYFGRDMWDDSYPEVLFNLDANFMMQCLQFYLYVNAQKEGRLFAPVKEILMRSNEQITEGPFSEFARSKFVANYTQYTNKEILCDVLLNEYNAFRRVKGCKEVKSNTLTAELKAWVATQTDMVFNPEDKCTDKTTRRIRHNNVSYYYIRKGPEEIEMPF